jgi:hypothetical protein
VVGDDQEGLERRGRIGRHSAADWRRDAVTEPSARDREYNFVQPVADPQDTMGSALLRLASGTQVLDILTALLWEL